MKMLMYLLIRAILIVLVGGVTMLHSASAPPIQRKPAPPDALVDLLERFADAWNRHDLDALMSMMTPDGVFEASGGKDVDGQRSEGQQTVRAAYGAVFDTFPDARWANARHFVNGNRGV